MSAHTLESNDVTLSTPEPLTPAELALVRSFRALLRETQSKWHELPLVMGTPDVARALGISTTAASWRAYSGAIPMRKMGSRWVIDQVAFRDWLASRGEKP